MEQDKGVEVVKKILDYVWDLIPEETQEGASNRYSILLSALVSYVRYSTKSDDPKIIMSMCDDIRNELLEKVGKNDDKNKS